MPTNKELAQTVETLEKGMNRILDLLEKKADVPKTVEEVKVEAAKPDKVDTNPEWESTAKEILGDYCRCPQINLCCARMIYGETSRSAIRSF